MESLAATLAFVVISIMIAFGLLVVLTGNHIAELNWRYLEAIVMKGFIVVALTSINLWTYNNMISIIRKQGN